MSHEHVLLDYAKSRQRELWRDAAMVHQARLARAARAPHRDRSVSTLQQLWRSLWSGSVRESKKPVTEHATA